jgi:hypothetical protein
MKIPRNHNYEAELIRSLSSFEAAVDGSSTALVRPHEIWSVKNPPDLQVVPGLIHGPLFRNKVIALTNKDFSEGTLRVLEPCKLLLCEDICFNPNPGVKKGLLDRERGQDSDWFPSPRQKAYFPQMTASQPQEADKAPTATGCETSAAPPGPLPFCVQPSSGFRLGFFAAITIEHGDGTILDLNGYRLACHEHFALQQRFHAILELANQPFIHKQGPADFGPNLRPARKVWIRNGEIGRSSHHGIHGNGMQDILISDVTFRDYEVAAISLNGGRRIVIQDCQMEGTFRKVPVIGTYSAGRFAKLMAEQRLHRAKGPDFKEECKSLSDALDAMKSALDDMFEHVFPETRNPSVNGEANEEGSPDIRKLFGNFDTKGTLGALPDANPYGVALHARGFLVNAFLCAGSKVGGIDDLARAFECTDVTLRRVNVARTAGNVHEVLALATKAPDGSWVPIADAAGAVVRFFEMDSQLQNHGRTPLAPPELDLSTGGASLSVLGRVQFALAALERKMVAKGLLHLDKAAAKKLFPLVDWAFDTGSRWKITADDGRPGYFWLNGPEDSDRRELRILSNGDTMHHVNKGALGIFIQAVDGLCMERVVVAGVENTGLPGSAMAGPYQGPDDGGHGSQEQQVGYSGCDSRGIYLGACSNVTADRIQAHAVNSSFASATGIQVGGGSEHVEILSALAGNVIAGSEFSPRGVFVPFTTLYPNGPATAIGLHIDNTTRNICIEDFQMVGALTQPGRKMASKIVIESRLNHLSPEH